MRIFKMEDKNIELVSDKKENRIPDDYDKVSNGKQNEEEDEDNSNLEYSLLSKPPASINTLYVIQTILANITAPVTTMFFIHATICADDNQVLLAELIASTTFLGGLATLLMVTFGVRLPIFQGASFAYVPPIIAMMKTNQWKCPPPLVNGTCILNGTCEIDPWRPRLNEASGGLICASIIHSLIGATGAIGFLMRYIGPLTIVPTIALVSLSLFQTATYPAQEHWGIAMGTIGLYLVFALVLQKVTIPFLGYKKGHGFLTIPVKVFKIYPHVLVIIIMWLVSLICTVTDQFPDDASKRGYLARTDAKLDNIYNMPWIFMTYPSRYGSPTVGAGIFIGMFAACISSIVESVGDYYATARVCQVPVPAKHAINRAVAIEGLSSLLSGVMGVGHATTSFSGVIGLIQVTGFASRFNMQLAAIILMFLGVFGKFGAALSIIPDPIIGGLSIITFSMLFSVAITNIKFLDLSSSRNLLILGVAVMLGMVFPFWIDDNPDVINTGSPDFDQVLVVFLSTGMFVGGITGFILDNLIPGSKEERGLEGMLKAHSGSKSDVNTVYDLPWVTGWTRKYNCFSYLPFMPSYTERPCVCCRKRKVDNVESGSDDVNCNKDADGDIKI